jgi:tRNA U34 5-carboxymethylaminomethyl modifying GTPase MnmE/TrmE
LFWLVDTSVREESLEAMKKINPPTERTWILYNKIDLVSGLTYKNFDGFQSKQFGVSCLSGEGLEQVVQALGKIIESPARGENILVTHQRHHQELEIAEGCLQRLQKLIHSGESMELWAEELRESLLALGRIRGQNLPASAFEEIFSKFCIGK